MIQAMSCSAHSGRVHFGVFASLDFDKPVLQSMIDILSQPRVHVCPQCHGKGLLAHHLVCPSCKGYGKTP